MALGDFWNHPGFVACTRGGNPVIRTAGASGVQLLVVGGLTWVVVPESLGETEVRRILEWGGDRWPRTQEVFEAETRVLLEQWEGVRPVEEGGWRNPYSRRW